MQSGGGGDQHAGLEPGFFGSVETAPRFENVRLDVSPEVLTDCNDGSLESAAHAAQSYALSTP